MHLNRRIFYFVFNIEVTLPNIGHLHLSICYNNIGYTSVLHSFYFLAFFFLFSIA